MLRLCGAAAICALLAVAGCFGPRSDTELATPRSHDEWTTLITEIRAFARTIGFEPTNNFRTFSRERTDYPFCGHVSRLYLPYSYEDPAIKWLNAPTREECFAHGEGADVTFGTTEAIAERGTPVTTAMLLAPLHRFLYVVVHEDCHEQFGLPYGIEEALCNVIAFRAMAAFGEQRFKSMPAERRAIDRFAREGAEHSRVTVATYSRLAALYDRHAAAQLSEHALLKERALILRGLEKQISWPRNTMNNVWLANAMTYSRHHAMIERVFEVLGRDLARTVAFFKQVDAAKPTPAEIMAKHRIPAESSVEFVRAYEAAIVETIERLVRRSREGGNPGAL